MLTRRALLAGPLVLAACEAFAQGVPGMSPPPGMMSGAKAFATWNPMDAGGDMVLSNGNLTWSAPADSRPSPAGQILRATTAKSSGKYYFEITFVSGTNMMFGVAKAGSFLGYRLGADADGYGYSAALGSVANNNTTIASGGASVAASDVVGIAIDLTASKLWFSKNNVWQFSGNPAAGTGGISIATGNYYPSSGTADVAASGMLNVGAVALAYAPPSGFLAWG